MRFTTTLLVACAAATTFALPASVRELPGRPDPGTSLQQKVDPFSRPTPQVSSVPDDSMIGARMSTQIIRNGEIETRTIEIFFPVGETVTVLDNALLPATPDTFEIIAVPSKAGMWKQRECVVHPAFDAAATATKLWMVRPPSVVVKDDDGQVSLFGEGAKFEDHQRILGYTCF